MIAWLLSRWLKPQFYVCEWQTIYDPITSGEFPCNGHDCKSAWDDGKQFISSNYSNLGPVVFGVRPATLRERMK